MLDNPIKNILNFQLKKGGGGGGLVMVFWGEKILSANGKFDGENFSVSDMGRKNIF